MPVPASCPTLAEEVQGAPTIINARNTRSALGTRAEPGPHQEPAAPAASTTPVKALWLEELARTRIFLKVIIGIVLAVYLCFPWLGGDPRARWDLRKAENYTLVRLILGGVERLNLDARIAIQFLVQIMLLSVFVMARLSRRTSGRPKAL